MSSKCYFIVADRQKHRQQLRGVNKQINTGTAAPPSGSASAPARCCWLAAPSPPPGWSPGWCPPPPAGPARERDVDIRTGKTHGHTHMDTWTHTHGHTHMDTWTHGHTHMDTWTHGHTRTHTHTMTYRWRYTRMERRHEGVNGGGGETERTTTTCYLVVGAHTHTHTHTHMHRHTHTHTRTHTHTHTHTRYRWAHLPEPAGPDLLQVEEAVAAQTRGGQESGWKRGNDVTVLLLLLLV